MTNLTEKKVRRDGIRQVISCLVVFLPVMSGGMASGWTSPTEEYLKGLGDETTPKILTWEQFSWVTSFLYFGGMAGCLIWNLITEKFGRKVAGYLVGTSQIASWSGILCSTNFTVLLICRFFLGIALVGGAVVGMSYSNEITSVRLKGPLCSLGALFINLGFLLVFVIGCTFSYQELNMVCLSIPVIFLMLFIKLPESPVYLMMDNQEKKAHESFMWFRGNKTHKVGREMAAIQASPTYQTRITIVDVISSKKLAYSMFTGMMLFMGQQLSGITILTSYAVAIFDESGSKWSPQTCTIAMGIFQVLGCGVPSFVANKVNQRYLLACTHLSAALSLLLLGSSYYAFELGYKDPILNALPLVAMLGYILSFTAGIAPVPFILFTRMFEPNIMSLAMSFGQLAGNCSGFLTAKIFSTLTHYFHFSGTFFILAACNVILAIYVLKCIKDNSIRLQQKEVPPDVLIPADQNGIRQNSKAVLLIN